MNSNMIGKLQQIGQLIKGMKNPQQAILQLLSNNTNPMAKQVLKMAENGDIQGIEQFARNVVKEQGKNFDEEINKFKNKLGM